jgi:hypothetical protein
MRDKYYSVRSGKHSGKARFDLGGLKRQFLAIDSSLANRGYFQEAFGYHCVDAGDVAGTLGSDIDGAIMLATHKSNLWPVHLKVEEYTEDDLFDMIEFSFDHVSKPLTGRHHDFGGCGWHYYTFDSQTGRYEYRALINRPLALYGEGYELSERGEMLALVEDGLSVLYEAPVPVHDPENVDARVQAAILRFRRYKSSLEDRKHAVRDLVDVLEYLRPKVQQVLKRKDEADLFAIANGFGIRHHRQDQKTDYDESIWHSWMFNYYLATIHACLRLLDKKRG